MSEPNELEQAKNEIAALKTRLRDRDAKDQIPIFNQYAGYIFDELRRADFLPESTDPWALQSSVVQHNFEEAIRRGCSDV